MEKGIDTDAQAFSAVPAAWKVGGAKRFFDLAVDMLCLLGVDGYLKVINPAWSRTLEWSTAELTGRPYIDFVHPDDRVATKAEAAKLAGGFATVQFRNRWQHRDGSYRWLGWTATPAMDDGVIYAAARDITSMVLAEEQEIEHTKQQLLRVKSALDTRQLQTVFQPIIELKSRKVVGVEALARFGLSPKRPPDEWFAEADEVGLRPELEMRAVRQALPHVDRLPAGTFLALNVSPETLLTRDFAEELAVHDGSRLVIEVTEHAAVEDYNRLQQAISLLRADGVRFAIDDAGAGFSSMKHIVRLVPDFIKLDFSLTRDIDSDPVKRALASALVTFCSEIGALLIGEGVETRGELDVLLELGFEEAQGFYLAKPYNPRR